MSILKTLFIVSLFSAVSISTYSQADSTEIDDDTDSSTQIVQLNKIALVKGVYKTYEEYLSNSPSVEAAFTLTPLQITRNNPLIVEADVDYKEKRPRKIWGIADGEYVYIRVMTGKFFKNHYYRLQCDGPTPYIYVVENNVIIPTGLGLAVMATVAATSAALPPFVYIYVVRDNTNYAKPVWFGSNGRIKRYLKYYPDLLEAYEKEPKHNKATKAKYLTDYNKRKLENPG